MLINQGHIGPFATCSLEHNLCSLIKDTSGVKGSTSTQHVNRERRFRELRGLVKRTPPSIGSNMIANIHPLKSKPPASRFACFKSKIQLFGRVIARGGKSRGGAAKLFAMKGRKIEGGVYSCSGYERYHRRRQVCTNESRMVKQNSSGLSANHSTIPHTVYPLLQAAYPAGTVQENSSLQKSSSVWDVTLEEEVLEC